MSVAKKLSSVNNIRLILIKKLPCNEARQLLKSIVISNYFTENRLNPVTFKSLSASLIY